MSTAEDPTQTDPDEAAEEAEVEAEELIEEIEGEEAESGTATNDDDE